MSYVTSYPALRAELMTYVEDDSAEFQAELDNIISRGLDIVQRMLDLDMFRETVPTSVAFNQRTIVRADALKIRSVFFPAISDFAVARSYDFCRAFQGKGQPLYWCERTTGTIYLSPTPDQNYAVDIEMLARATPISAASPTNWITDHCGDLLLLACLTESEMFLKAPQRTAEFLNALQLKGQQYAQVFGGQNRNGYSPLRPASQRGAA
ncbi:MAG: hypothetical protein ABL908_07970 [Hyphomicrobium sp.]